MPELSPKTKVIIAVAAAFILMAGGYLLLQRNNDQAATVDEDSIVYEPATEVEKGETEQHKDRIAEEQDQEDTDNDDSKQEVKPLITSWGQDSSGSDFYVNGYVPGVVEQDGTCTLEMKKDRMTASQQKVAFFNAQSTSCGRIAISFNELSVGSWQAVLSYSSGTSSGASDVIEVEVK